MEESEVPGDYHHLTQSNLQLSYMPLLVVRTKKICIISRYSYFEIVQTFNTKEYEILFQEELGIAFICYCESNMFFLSPATSTCISLQLQGVHTDILRLTILNDSA